MDRSVFARHFREAAGAARELAKQFIEEQLFDAMRFRVHLNSSYDGHARAELKLFPEESADDRTLATKSLDEDGVVGLLWRDGFVPQWIDLMVVGETGATTILDVVACGRFTDDEELLYYAQTAVAPFGVKGPCLPVKHIDGKRFSIHERSSCWSLGDLEGARQNAPKVWSLELHGPVFDDRALATPLAFPRLEILELHGVSLRGPGLRSLEGLPSLRHLRAGFSEMEALDFSSLPTIPTVESLSLRHLPANLQSLARLAESLPSLSELTVGSINQARADTTVVLQRVERLTLECPNIPAWIAMPQALRWLAVHAPDTTDADLERCLSACPEQLDSLGLRGTPVSDAVFSHLDRFPLLKYLDAVDTRITEDALRRFAERRPGFKCWPKLAPISEVRGPV